MINSDHKKRYHACAQKKRKQNMSGEEKTR